MMRRKEVKRKKKELSKKPRFQYSQEKLLLAVDDVRRGQTIRGSSEKFGVPASTICAKLHNKYPNKKPGPSTVLSTEEEKELVTWIIESSHRGFPITKVQLSDSVQTVCVEMKKKNPFTNNRPGNKWYKSFLLRHPQIAVRVSENVTLSRAQISKKSVKKWFEDCQNYLSKNDLLSIPPQRVFNCDETGVPLNPKPKKVLSGKGTKDVYNIVGNNEKENITVLVTGSAAGELAPTFVLFKGKSLPKNTYHNAPSDFCFGYSENGWMLSKNFYEYIANVFEPWLCAKQIIRPVILYIDGHSSHLTLHLSKFCSEKQIILVALHPNATHVLQPLDVSFFKPFKSTWQQLHRSTCEASASIGLTKQQFAPIVKKTFDSLDVKKLLENGFKKCGLYPFDVNAVDMKKILPSTDTLELDSSVGLNENSNDIFIIEKYLSEDKKQTFILNEGPVWKGCKSDEALYQLWYSVSQTSIQSDYLNVEVFPSTDVFIPATVIAFNEEESQDSEIALSDTRQEILIELQFDSEGKEITNQNIHFESVIDRQETKNVETIEPQQISNSKNTEVDLNETSIINEALANDELVLDLSMTKNSPLPVQSVLLNASVQNKIDQKHTVKDFLPWPSIQQKSKKRTTKCIQFPSIVSGREWQVLAEEKEKQKSIKEQNTATKRKLRLQKAEQVKIKKESDTAAKEEKLFVKEQEKLSKEKEKLMKQQEKIKNIEEKKRKAEENILKRIKKEELAKQIADLKHQQNQL